MRPRRQTELFCEWLENYLDYERIRKKEDFSLETIRFLVQRFKNPQASFRSIHVAGSKGKGSVSVMLSSILEASGRQSGLYTSPHLLDFTERVTRSGQPFSEEIYGRACDRVVPLVDSIIPGSIPGHGEPSWFELVTLFSFVVFQEAKLPWAVIETGLGGRLDATNVILPEASVITPIELEHTEYLGNTIEAIAGEKAGIIKPGVPVFTAPQDAKALSVLRAKAQSMQAPLIELTEVIDSLHAEPVDTGLKVEISFKHNRWAFNPEFSRPLSFTLSLPSIIQAENAALAACAAKAIIPDLEESVIEEGLSRAWLPGRFEIVGNNPPLVLDGAHTVKSLALTMKTFRSRYSGPANLVFACAADKNVDEMARLFDADFAHITVTRPGDKKQSDFDRVLAAFERERGHKADSGLEGMPDYQNAIVTAVQRSRDEGRPLLITGSFYLVAEAKKLLASLNPDR